MVKYRQGIAIIDTADPILFRFLARADTGDVAVPPERALLAPPPLAEAVDAMEKIKEADKRQSQTEAPSASADSMAANNARQIAPENEKGQTKSNSRTRVRV